MSGRAAWLISITCRGAVHLPRDCGQQRWRMEHRRREPANHCHSALLADVVVSDARLAGAGRNDRANLLVAHHAVEPQACCAGSLLAAVDRIAGERAQTDRRRVARQLGAKPGDYQKQQHSRGHLRAKLHQPVRHYLPFQTSRTVEFGAAQNAQSG